MIRALLVEDNPGDVRLVREVLRDGFTLVCVDRVAAAIEALGAERFDVVLLDLSLPDARGLETFTRVRAAAGDVAVLVLTSADDDELALRAVREGAQDYLVKGRLDADGVARAVRHAIERNALLVQLRDLDRVRTLFLSVVSHDAKNLAAAILAGLDLLRSERLGPLTADQQRALGLTKRSAERQLHLLADLLDAAAIASGALAVRRREVALAEVAGAVVDELGPLAAERGIAVRVEGDAGTASVDPDRLAQALTNLVSNALRYARSEVVLGVSRGEDGGVRLTVADDGPGVDAADVPRLFERFAAGRDGGTGLGLAIVAGIARAHGGSAAYDAPPGGGARFVVALPWP